MIKSILYKIFKPRIDNFERFKDFLKIDPTTVYKNSTVRFDFPEKLETRMYLTIKSNCIINANFIFETEKGIITIGKNVHIGAATFICRNKIEIHNDVTMAWGITIYDHNSHSIFWEERKNDNIQCFEDYTEFNGNNVFNKDWTNVVSKPIVISSKVWIGFDVTILKGVIIGEGAVVGAKSVVTKDVEAWTVVAGNPAKIVKYLPEYHINKIE